MPPLIRTVQLARLYRSGAAELPVFTDINLEVERGERLAIVGESGAGKSTLLYLLGLLDRPSAGAIYFESRSLLELTEAELAEFRNRQVGFVWQIHYLLPEFTALENVMMPLLIGGRSQRQAEPEAAARLAEVGLADRASHRSGELSGGEQQRVALARALVHRPSLLLADEPTGNLDLRNGEMIFDLIGQLHRSHNLTSVIVTHNVAFARKCDRVLRLEAGRLIPLEGEESGPGRSHGP
jgi:lipoprotein-releasing system ATP-binding protein